MGGGDAKANQDPANKRFGLGVSTPREMVSLLERLERGLVVSKQASAEMIAILKRQQTHEGVGRTLRGATIANKTGALDRLRSDVAIVYSERGRIAMAITVDDLPETDWTVENPGRPLADADLQIAATALLHDLELVTGNLKHFSRVPGLRVSPALAEARPHPLRCEVLAAGFGDGDGVFVADT
jgi:hypothetical protein